MTQALPTVIDTLNYTTIEASKISRFKIAWAALRALYPTLPDYDVQILETDPAKILLQVSAVDELSLRARINDAAVRANLYQFSFGDDLDAHAGFYGVLRMLNELDDRLIARITLAIAGRSTAGPVERYAFVAMSSSIRVRAVKIYRIGNGPALAAAILSTDNNGIPDRSLLNTVTEALNSESVLTLNDSITVVPAIRVIANVVARVWLLPEAASNLISKLEAALRSAWDAEAGIGFDLNPSWIVSRLHVDGVSRIEVDAPAHSVVALDNDAIAIGTVTLTLVGRSR